MFRATIRTDLELRLLEERHAAEVFALVNQDRAYLRQWLPWVDSTLTADDSVAFIRAALEQFAAGDGITAGMWHRKRFAGVIGTQKIQKFNHKVELGYWLGEASQGQGLGDRFLPRDDYTFVRRGTGLVFASKFIARCLT